MAKINYIYFKEEMKTLERQNINRAIIIGTIFFLVSILLISFFPKDGGDYEIYTRIAENIRNGHGVSLSTSEPYVASFGGNQPPGYAAFVAALNVNPTIVRLVQSVIVCFSIGLFAYFYGWLPAAFSILFIGWTRFIQPEILCVALILLLLCLFRSDLKAKAILSGVIVLFSVYLRTDGILLLVPVLFTLGWKRTFIAFSIVTIGFGAWMVRSHIVGVNIIQPPMTAINSHGELRSPKGFLFWCWTWATNEHSAAGWAFPICRPSYNTLFFPDEAYANTQERITVDSLIAELRLNPNGEFPEHIDNQFLSLAMNRFRNDPFRILIVLPLKRLIALWFHPGHSHGMPGELQTMDNEVRNKLDNNKLRYALFLFNDYPLQMSQKMVLFLLMSVLEIAGLWGAIKSRNYAVLSYLLIRTLFLSLTNFVAGRYMVQAIPFLMAGKARKVN